MLDRFFRNNPNSVSSSSIPIFAVGATTRRVGGSPICSFYQNLRIERLKLVCQNPLHGMELHDYENEISALLSLPKIHVCGFHFYKCTDFCIDPPRFSYSLLTP